jgi:hypothetical protein
MQSEGIQWGGVLRGRGVPADLLRLRNQAERRGRQGGHVQHLANMASRIRRIAVVMVESRACDKVQQRQTTQDCQRPAHASVLESSPDRVHTPLAVECTSFDG